MKILKLRRRHSWGLGLKKGLGVRVNPDEEAEVGGKDRDERSHAWDEPGVGPELQYRTTKRLVGGKIP